MNGGEMLRYKDGVDGLGCGRRRVTDPLSLAVRRAETAIRAEPGDPYSARGLASTAGVSARSLFRGFRRLRGHGPMAAVRRARLERVREDLLTADAKLSVTEIAMRWGFYHLGRFAGIYCRQFGERPSETRQRSRCARRAA
jgi:transcriptional regulator GlxA family with amidase domain